VLLALVGGRRRALGTTRSGATTSASPPVRRKAGARELWRPFGAGERVLGVEDDIAFRQMLRALRQSKLLDYTVSDPIWRPPDRAAERLESIVAHDPDPVLRSRASSLLGVVSVSSWNSTPPQGTQQLDRSELLLAAVASFEQAIALDPENDDAKYNLQLMLQRGKGLLPTEAAAGKNPSAAARDRAEPEPARPAAGTDGDHLLTPLGALIALGVVVPLSRSRFSTVAASRSGARSACRSPGRASSAPPSRQSSSPAALLGLAAAQPRLEWTSDKRVRDDAEAIVVLDTSRSMLARTSPRSPIRYARATDAARRFRAAFPDVPVGIASFTDRVLPHLFPEPGRRRLRGDAEQVARHRPAAAARLVRLDSDPACRARVDRQPPLLHPDRPQAADLRDHRRRECPDRRREDRRRVPATAGRRHDLPARLGRRRAGLHGNQLEPQYSPDPRSRGILDAAADTLGGRVYAETSLDDAIADRPRELGDGPTVVEGENANRLALAPYLAGAIFLPRRSCSGGATADSSPCRIQEALEPGLDRFRVARLVHVGDRAAREPQHGLRARLLEDAPDLLVAVARPAAQPAWALRSRASANAASSIARAVLLVPVDAVGPRHGRRSLLAEPSSLLGGDEVVRRLSRCLTSIRKFHLSLLTISARNVTHHDPALEPRHGPALGTGEIGRKNR
jgi:hypothetical protein